MPRSKKYDKEKIISTALKIVEEKGIDNLSARTLARELGCTVNPIFNNFGSMEELSKVLYERIYDLYSTTMKKGAEEEKSYKGMGLAYINFARNHREFFKMLFMQNTQMAPEKFILSDKIGKDVIKEGTKLTNFDYETQKKFHVKVWIFTHGLATMIATHTVTLTDNEISHLLESTVREMLEGFKKGIY